MVDITDIREKWNLFDESTSVPLIIYHPLSPFKGQKYPFPVESIDVFPTINDLLGVQFDRKRLYADKTFVPLSGKSLAPVILGQQFKSRSKKTNSLVQSRGVNEMPYLNHTFSITQTWRCSDLEASKKDPRKDITVSVNHHPWDCCNLDTKAKDFSNIVSVMGYGMRTVDFRYNAYIHVLRPHRIPDFSKPLYGEELYDHRGDKEGDLGTKETINLAYDPLFESIVTEYREKLRHFLYNEVVFLNLTTTFAKKFSGHVGGAKGGGRKGFGGLRGNQ